MILHHKFKVGDTVFHKDIVEVGFITCLINEKVDSWYPESEAFYEVETRYESLLIWAEGNLQLIESEQELLALKLKYPEAF
jgi:hypothetical protein